MIIYIFYFIIIIYSVLILLFYFYWIFYNDFTDNNKLCEPENIIASVVVTVRNEEENILNCLKSLTSQYIANNKIEIIISDDYSTDKTVTVAENFINTFSSDFFSIKLIKSNNKSDINKGSKKYSQEIAIKQAKGEIVLLTDADCIYNNKWIITVLKYFTNNEILFASGPVQILTDKSLFSKLQSLEFASLVISGGSSIMMHIPIMSNAANMAFRKSAFIEISDKIPAKSLSSGDDIFLMSAFKKFFGKKSLYFIKESEAIVYTKPQKSLKSFIHQRIRWTSKVYAYRDIPQILVGLVVVLANFSIIGFLVITLFSKQFFLLFLIAVVIKSIPEFLLLYAGLKLFNSRKLLWYFFPLLIIYPFYIVSMPALSLCIKSRWKDRIIRVCP